MNASDPKPEPRFPLPRNLTLWLVAGGGALLLIILIIVAVSRPAAPTVTALDSPTPGGTPSPGMDNAEAERRAVARAQLQRFQHDADEARGMLAECDKELAAWDKEVESELTGKRGHAVAADDESLERFSAVYSQPRVTKRELDACRERLATLLQPAAAALASGAVYVPSAEANSRLSAERQFAESARKTLSDARQDALSVLTGAEKKGKGGTQSLKEALDDLELRRRKTRVDEIAARQEAARREATQLAAEAQAKQELEYGRSEAARIESETKRELEKRKAEETLKDAQTAQQVLETRAKDPGIRAQYKPFLESGRFRPHRDRTEKSGPMSYTDLKELCVFNDLRHFVNAGAGRWSRHGDCGSVWDLGNDRPKWPMPKHDEDYEPYRERFKEFCELAPIWAKDGTLSP